MQLSIKIDANIYELLKKIKERDGVPMAVSLSRAVEKYAHEKGVKQPLFCCLKKVKKVL